MNLKIIAACGLLLAGAQLSACSTPGPGPFAGISHSDEGAVTKIGCFKYTEGITLGPVLTPDEGRLCEVQAIKCQHQQNNQGSGFPETILANGAVSAGAGALSIGTQAKMLGVGKALAKKYWGVGAVVGAIDSVPNSAIIYSQGQVSPVAGCARDFLNYYKKLHPGLHDDLFVEPEPIRNNIQGNVRHTRS